MPCYKPIVGYQSRERNPKTGKRSIVFSAAEGYTDLVMEVACGRCIGCRLDRAHSWAIRIMHESQSFEHAYFITLTYNRDYYPSNGSLNKKHFQDFMKRLRARFPGKRISYFHCGEYGESLGRAHYHACIFGVDFPDREVVKPGKRPTYNSDLLEELWGMGWTTLQDLTFESAMYCASYVMKKITGDKAKEHYRVEIVDEQTGEVTGPHDLEPEYATMSTRPAIGKAWFETYQADAYPSDFIITGQGRKAKPPKYYDRLFREAHPDEMTNIERRRKVQRLKKSADNTPERLEVKERVRLAKLNLKKRNLEVL